MNEKRKGKGRLFHFFCDSRGKELDVRYQSKTFFLFFFFNGFIKPFRLIKISWHFCISRAKAKDRPRALIIFLPDVPRDKVNRLTTVQLGWSIARFFNLSGNDEADPCSTFAWLRASFFSSKFVSMPREIERHVLRSTGPLVFLGRERIELRLNLTRSPGDPLCPPSKISPPFNLIS